MESAVCPFGWLPDPKWACGELAKNRRSHLWRTFCEQGGGGGTKTANWRHRTQGWAREVILFFLLCLVGWPPIPMPFEWVGGQEGRTSTDVARGWGAAVQVCTVGRRSYGAPEGVLTRPVVAGSTPLPPSFLAFGARRLPA